MKNHEAELRLFFNQSTLITCRSLNVNCHGMMPDKTSYEKYLAFRPTRRRDVASWRSGLSASDRVSNWTASTSTSTGDSHFNPKDKKQQRAASKAFAPQVAP